MSGSPEITAALVYGHYFSVMKIGLKIRRAWQATGESRGAEWRRRPIRGSSLVESVGTSHVAPHTEATN